MIAGTDLTTFSFDFPPIGLTQSPRPGLAFGGLIDFDIAGPVQLETGIVFMLRRPEINNPNDPNPEPSSLRAAQFPLLWRVTTLDWLSVGAGMYYNQGFDKINQNSTNSSTPSEPGYGITNTSRVDYGIIGSVQFRLPLTHELRGLIDVRYLNGLSDVDTTGVNSKYFRDFQILVGMTIGHFK